MVDCHPSEALYNQGGVTPREALSTSAPPWFTMFPRVTIYNVTP